ncbi:MAG: N-acetyltransferase [Deltaproteobacteria bacterium]|nr:MAG: N-acetyltransferase [Deltaproteobacteria bacterium]
MCSDAAARREAGLMETTIRPIQGREEIDVCARMMAGSEPWITLQRDYDASAQTLTSPGKEVYVAADGSQILGFIILNMQGGFTGYIQSIGVAPEWRSRGIGRRLVAYAEERSSEKRPTCSSASPPSTPAPSASTAAWATRPSASSRISSCAAIPRSCCERPSPPGGSSKNALFDRFLPKIQSDPSNMTF